MTQAVAVAADDHETTWDLSRDGGSIGTAVTRVRRNGPLLSRLDVAPADAAEALGALFEALRARGEEALWVDVAPGDPVLDAAFAGRDAPVGAIQMRLDLTDPVAEPGRVRLRAMTAEEFAGYRDHLVATYAQDLFDSGAFTDHGLSLEASRSSTEELLPLGLESPGQHLWTAYDGDVPVAILWICVDGTRGYIYDIEVRDDQRRRGYGREVLDAGARAARLLGAEELGLNVFGHNTGALALYERAGYVITERTYRLPL
jgi:ribosomal protein S18 acetylase RimI-like enzyme